MASGEKSVGKGRRNRARIIKELLRESATFSELLKKVGLSNKTLSNHLKALLNEGLVKREVHGRYVVYVVVKPRTLLEMRKEVWNELVGLNFVYGSCLTKETLELFGKVFEALKESIEHPEPEAETTEIMGRLIKIPRGLPKGTVIEVPESVVDKVKFVKPKKRKRGSGR